MFTKALYYPHIYLPDNVWLRRAILYWDQVNPIVPHGLRSRAAGDEVFQALHAEGLSEWMEPDDAMRGRRYEQLMSEFRGLVSSERYLASLGPRGRRKRDMRIFRDKIAYGLVEELRELGLVQGPDRQGWFHFEWGTGELYMGYLAAAIAQSFGLEPLTDKREWQDSLLRSQLEEDDREQAFASFVLEGLIPTPRSDVGVAEIVAFRRRHEEELLRFRRAVRETVESLREVSDEVEVARKLDAVKDDVREQSLALARKLGENRIETGLSTLEVSVPAVAGLVAIGSWSVGAVLAGVGGVLKIGRQLLNGRIRKNSLLAENPYTYVYRIERELVDQH